MWFEQHQMNTCFPTGNGFRAFGNPADNKNVIYARHGNQSLFQVVNKISGVGCSRANFKFVASILFRKYTEQNKHAI